MRGQGHAFQKGLNAGGLWPPGRGAEGSVERGTRLPKAAPISAVLKQSFWKRDLAVLGSLV